MISLILIIIAAFLNSVMDRLENENFHVSVFKNLNQNFWYKRVSWKYAKKIFGWKLDAWHYAKSLMIISICLAVALYNPFIPVIDFIIFGIAWNTTFNLFYNHILKSK